MNSSDQRQRIADKPVLLAVAPNGARRTRSDHPALPITSVELGHAASAAAEAGAAMIHLHVRDDVGSHTLEIARYDEAIRAVRKAVGDRMIIQITTEAVGRYEPEEQMAIVREVRPEAVSLALREFCPAPSAERSFAEFLSWLVRERIAPQIILYDAADAAGLAKLVARGIVPDPAASVLYVLGRYGDAEAEGPRDLMPFLAAGDRFADFMVCAFGRREAECCVTAALLGGHVRVGFENNLFLPDGRLAPDNAALVTAVAEPLKRLGYRPASAHDIRNA